jgi:hypothetical protein
MINIIIAKVFICISTIMDKNVFMHVLKDVKDISLALENLPLEIEPRSKP